MNARSGRGRPGQSAVAGTLVGVVLAVVLAQVDELPGPADGPAAATEFQTAWRRSLTGTYAVIWRFERTLAGGNQLAYEVRMAQRPPARRREGGGVVEARTARTRTACATDAAGELRCRDAPARPFDEQVAAELRLLAPYVEGPRALYAVEPRGAGCWHLERRIPVPNAEYGDEALFCFHAATGALVRSEVRRTGAVDAFEAIEVRADVTPADLRPPGG